MTGEDELARLMRHADPAGQEVSELSDAAALATVREQIKTTGHGTTAVSAARHRRNRALPALIGLGLAAGIVGVLIFPSMRDHTAEVATSPEVTVGTHTPGPPTSVQRPTAEPDLALTPQSSAHVSWAVDVADSRALAEASDLVFTGTALEAIRTELDPSANLATMYRVRVDDVLKGEATSGDELEVRLPGGAMTLGDVIAAADSSGQFEMRFPEKGWDQGINPRERDPETLIIENWGTNPMSATQNAALEPDAWLYFINQDDEGGFVGAAWFYSLKYVKDGVVYNLSDEIPADPVPIEELRQ